MRTRFLTSLASAAAGIAFAVAAGSAQSLNGYAIALSITTDSGAEPITMRLKTAGAKLRVEMDNLPVMGGGGGGGMGGMTAGLYILPQDSNKIAVVLPAMGMAVSADISMITGRGGRGGGRGGRGGRMRGGAGGNAADQVGAMAGSIPEITDVSASVQDLGAGETILGHATHKYRIHSLYSVNGEKRDEVSDAWFATDLTGSDEGFGKFFTTFGAAFGGTNSSQSVADAVRAKLPKGFPLRVIRKTDAPSGPSTTTIEATEVTKTAFDPADFEIPANIQLMDTGSLMGGRRGGGID